jgi:SSS family solute:Na+ symporter
MCNSIPCVRFLTVLTMTAAVLVMSGCRSEIGQERQALTTALLREMESQKQFVKVHAAEALVSHGYHDLVRREFEQELDAATAPYSIGVWRVMARVAVDPAERARFVERIREVTRDAGSAYRVNAIESLAKLEEYRAEDRADLERFIARSDDASAAFALWLLALSNQPEDQQRLSELLDSKDPLARLRAAYALSRTPVVANPAIDLLIATLDAEPLDSPARVYLLSAAMRHGGSRFLPTWNSETQKYLQTGKPNEALEAGFALGVRGDQAQLPFLVANLNAVEADARIGSADGALRLLRLQSHPMKTVDWTMIAIFLVAMLAIGVYYSLSNQSREEYLLGGRHMRPWAVGISYFATMFSTVTYMSWPGEIIQHGPMMLAQIAGFPIAILLVGYCIIPYFMGLRVTSAYEILELRLGLSVRMLGSVFFLVMRLFWMAVIVHTTTVEILVPVAGLHPSTAPYLAAAICLITIIYTALGGFKAVVVTDVAQTVILFGGTIAAVVAITAQFGGFQWFPTEWDPRWQRPVFGFDPTVRVTFLGAIMALVSWHVCTAGSDQMAIQRYLATRDVKAARRMFTIALGTNAVVNLFLAGLGLSLYAYFKARPDMLNIGQTVERDADQFFQQFIVTGMPPGVSGLVVAGLLSAAMDSLSSGINSSSSVITVDFIERFRSGTASTSARAAQVISWIVGGAVVLLSTLVGLVHGNLLEVTFKVVNLLTAPLFGLFVMALWVRWATPLGTWIGAVAGVVTVVLVNYWRELTGSPGIGFIWSMPMSLTVQVVIGCLASLLPIGPRALPLLSRETVLIDSAV